jgi:hypothetical protein
MRPLRALVVLLVLLTAGLACAQEPEPIVIGGQIVARIRDKGSYDSLAARVSQIDKWISDVVSYENTQQPKLSMARKNGVLHIYCAKRPVIDIFPADATASNTTELALGQMWLKNIKGALPRATPVSRLPVRPPAPGDTPPPPTPAGPRIPSVPGGVTPAGTVVGSPSPAPTTDLSAPTPGASTTPTGDTVPEPTPAPLPQPAKTPRSAALLLLLDAFNSVRALSEDEYLQGRDHLAVNVLANLEPYMEEARGTGEASGQPQPPRPPIEVVPPKPAEPPTISVQPPKPPTGPIAPGVPRIPTVPSTTGGTVAPVPSVPTTGDANTARVPQKQRIKRKFAAAEKPFLALKGAGDPKAGEVADLLKESRDASTAGDFDTAEAKVDEALRLLGVPIPQ